MFYILNKQLQFSYYRLKINDTDSFEVIEK